MASKIFVRHLTRCEGQNSSSTASLFERVLTIEQSNRPPTALFAAEDGPLGNALQGILKIGAVTQTARVLGYPPRHLP